VCGVGGGLRLGLGHISSIGAQAGSCGHMGGAHRLGVFGSVGRLDLGSR
jgi:hypothetical protein